MELREIEAWLREEREEELARLWERADEIRRQSVGEEVHLRGLVEISNRCRRECHYCGLRAGNRQLSRYRMTAEEIMSCAAEAVAYGYGTVVMQAGEDEGITRDWMAGIIRQIRRETPLAVTLSLGERADEDLKAWREAGADRYLLRFETSNRALFEQIHPPLADRRSDRLAILRKLAALGYEIGSGVMIGIPGQTYGDLARDIALFQELDLDMIGVGPFIAHPGTPLGQDGAKFCAPSGEQVPATELMTYKTIALSRLLCPEANIPSTTALATLNLAQGRELGLSRGANIVMPNLTPVAYRADYEIYPAKACIRETAAECRSCLGSRILSIGRTVGKGQGGRRRTLPRRGTHS
ncbi:MAG: [FeFe] hydrogenase H-cluster radical SAM maturase HydE [Deltaproteobacteria bacterium]|nr:[FeFe] hydrogenase H-cluster radical SAM maturase HydE [Deltaproteobacteria bacterium]